MWKRFRMITLSENSEPGKKIRRPSVRAAVLLAVLNLGMHVPRRRGLEVAIVAVVLAASGGVILTAGSSADADDDRDAAELLFEALAGNGGGGLDAYGAWDAEARFSPHDSELQNCDAMLSSLGVSNVGHLKRMIADDVSVHAIMSGKMTIDKEATPWPMLYGIGGDWMSVKGVPDDDGQPAFSTAFPTVYERTRAHCRPPYDCSAL